MNNSSPKESQRKVILKYLQEHPKYGITSYEAFSFFGITRLASIIFDLRKLGYNIEIHLISIINRFGNRCQYAQYILKEG